MGALTKARRRRGDRGSEAEAFTLSSARRFPLLFSLLLLFWRGQELGMPAKVRCPVLPFVLLICCESEVAERKYKLFFINVKVPALH